MKGILCCCDLYDLMKKAKNLDKIPPAYEQGRRNDYLVSTRGAFYVIVSAGMDAFKAGVTTDHHLILFGLNIIALLGHFDKDPNLYESGKLQSTLI